MILSILPILENALKCLKECIWVSQKKEKNHNRFELECCEGVERFQVPSSPSEVKVLKSLFILY